MQLTRPDHINSRRHLRDNSLRLRIPMQRIPDPQEMGGILLRLHTKMLYVEITFPAHRLLMRSEDSRSRITCCVMTYEVIGHYLGCLVRCCLYFYQLALYFTLFRVSFILNVWRVIAFVCLACQSNLVLLLSRGRFPRDGLKTISGNQGLCGRR